MSSIWGMIGTWRMSLEGIRESSQQLKIGRSARQSVINAIKAVEDFPYYKSVGYGGLPNEEGIVELDAAFMDGSSLAIGAVAGIKNIANPILVAEALSHERFNNFLVGKGAERWAKYKGFEMKNMLTDRAYHYYKRYYQQTIGRGLSPYSGHDTVGIIALDQQGNICVGTSTSGLFMKRQGRVGDSPLSGSGFYADSDVGAATATGLGEDLMKGCTSYEIVRKMRAGISPQKAAEITVSELELRLLEKYGKAGDLSVVCMDIDGNFGVASNIDTFSFVATNNELQPTVFLAKNKDTHTFYEPADNEWMRNYQLNLVGDLK